MPFQARVRDLCEQLANSKDEAVSLRLAQELQVVLHEEIELMRSKAIGVPLLDAHRIQKV
jgi:hypothetical protein